MADAPFDVSRAHRWFAVECNNAAWDLIESPTLSAEQAERMIQTAHASCYHWSVAGNDMNHLRAYCLLATAYLRIKNGPQALHYAQLTVQSSERVGVRQTPFDRATALATLAHARHLSGDEASAKASWKEALDAAGRLDSDERALFDGIYPPIAE